MVLLALTGASPASGAARRPTGQAPRSGGVGLVGASDTSSTPAHPVVQGWTAKILRGVAYAPSSAPLAVKRAIWAGNKIRHKPYVWGGGHGRWNDTGYDCSGSVSYVLHAAGLLSSSLDSSGFMSWEVSGPGTWITVYANPGHAYVEMAGVRLDTSAEGDKHPAPGSGPRWRPVMKSHSSFVARSPDGY